MFVRMLVAGLVVAAPAALAAQDHSSHAGHAGSAAAGEVGQAAFAAIAEVVRLLDADPATDWSRVDIEALRRHLVTMDRVMLRAQVGQRDVPGGVAIEATGSGDVAASIREMLPAHAAALTRELDADVATTAIPGGVRMVVTVRPPGDARAVARIRGLGFAGLLVLGSHHAAHHLSLARGDTPMEHRMRR